MPRIRPVYAPMVVLVTLACSDMPQSLVAPPEAYQGNGPASLGGGNGGNNGNGGGGEKKGGGGTTLVEEFDVWDDDRWAKGDRPAGHGYVLPENVDVRDGALQITLPEGTLNGGSIRTHDRYLHGTYRARMKVADRPGAIGAFFLYGHDSGYFNEIDIELVPDRGQVWFTVWTDLPEAGPYIPTHHSAAPLDFDPFAFHDYTIEFKKNFVRFYVDGVLYAEFRGDLPTGSMNVRANAWFPSWLDGNGSDPTAYTVIDWIRF